MALLIFGSLLIVMGLLAGSVLLIAPLGIAEITPGIALWLLFPGFSIGGYILLIVATEIARLRVLSIFLSSLLLLLAAAAAAELLLCASTLLQPVGNTWGLWYVLVISGLLGVIGAGSFKLPPMPQFKKPKPKTD
ncbi:MAG: hypothetical protein ACRCU9_13665 [Iodobacter sp.]|jgi:hypothetical protein